MIYLFFIHASCKVERKGDARKAVHGDEGDRHDGGGAGHAAREPVEGAG